LFFALTRPRQSIDRLLFIGYEAKGFAQSIKYRLPEKNRRYQLILPETSSRRGGGW
jgi:hypothetical protein